MEVKYDRATELLGPALMMQCEGRAESVDTEAALRGSKIIGLYFSASWCTPCQEFTRQLTSTFESVTSGHWRRPKGGGDDDAEGGGAGGAGAGFGAGAGDPSADADAAAMARVAEMGESAVCPGNTSMGKQWSIVFVPWCYTEEDMAKYWATMPFLAMPWEAEPKERKHALDHHFKVHSVPSLVLCDARDMSVVCRMGVDMVQEDPAGDMWPWAWPHATELCEVDDGCRLVHELTLVAFVENETDENKTKAKKALEQVATFNHCGVKGDRERVASGCSACEPTESELPLKPTLYLFSTHCCGPSAEVRGYCGLRPVPHPCPMEPMDEDIIEDARYTTEPITCSACKAAGVEIHRCDRCNYNLCEACWARDEETRRETAASPTAERAALRAPCLVLLAGHLTGGCYRRRLAPGGVTTAAVCEFLRDAARGGEECDLDFFRTPMDLADYE